MEQNNIKLHWEGTSRERNILKKGLNKGKEKGRIKIRLRGRVRCRIKIRER